MPDVPGPTGCSCQIEHGPQFAVTTEAACSKHAAPPCPDCEGSGSVADRAKRGKPYITNERPCPRCKGTGRLSDA